MSLDDYTLIGPLTYRGKVGCMNATCTRRSVDGFGPDIPCFGWHCVYCDAPCSYQGHRCDAADAVLEAARAAAVQPPEEQRR